MNGFEDMGNAILLANEGQQQIARALGKWIASLFGRVAPSTSNA